MQAEIRELALSAGLHSPTFTDLRLAKTEKQKFKQATQNSPMAWLNRQTDARLLEKPILENAKSILIGLVPYPTNLDSTVWATYSLFKDYHSVIGDKLNGLILAINEKFPTCRCSPFVDAMSISEKIVAEKAGLGFRGRNTLIINDKWGSRFFLCGLLLSEAIPPDETTAMASKCGDCRLCETVCPGKALKNGELSVRRCLAWQTIEHKGPFESDWQNGLRAQPIGCGLCEKVCPYNKERSFAPDGEWPPFKELAAVTPEQAKDWALNRFSEKFGDTVWFRGGAARVMRNLESFF